MARNITTTNYSWPNPDPNDKINTAGYWGTDLYACIAGIDTKIASVASMIPSVSFVVDTGVLLSVSAFAGTATAIQFDGTNFASGVFTTPTTAVYRVSAHVNCNTSSLTSIGYIDMYIGAGIFSRASHKFDTTTGWYTLDYTATITAGTGIQVKAYRQPAGTLTVNSGTGTTYMQVVRYT